MEQKAYGRKFILRVPIAWLLLAVTSALLPDSAAAQVDCNLSSFDQTAPVKLFGTKKSSDGEFSYASDLDKVNGILMARNYVKNESASVGRSFRWEGTSLFHHPAKPLPPGEVACNEFPAPNSTMEIDDGSPIYYGPNDAAQPASVYVRSDRSGLAEGSSSSIFKSSFVNSDGKNEEFEVSVSYATSDNVLKSVDIETSENVVVVLSAEGQFWSSSIIDSFLSAAGNGGGEVGISDPTKFANLTMQD